MKGTILNYNQQLKEGIISGEDGNRYSFFDIEWKEEYIPVRGQYVDFNVNDLNQATAIYLLDIPQKNTFNLQKNDAKHNKKLLTEESYGLFDWTIKCIRMENYVNFSGRARRAECWYFQLFQVILGLVIGVFAGFSGVQYLDNILSIVFFLPSLAVYVRRLHDVNRSGWWLLIAFTLIGLIPLLIWLVQDTKPKPNRWGSPAK